MSALLRALTKDPALARRRVGLGAEREGIHTRYAQLSSSSAAEHEARLLARLDGWAGSWTTEWTEACAATRIRGERRLVAAEALRALGREDEARAEARAARATYLESRAPHPGDKLWDSIDAWPSTAP